MEQDDLDAILSRRFTPQPREGLSARIVYAALQTVQVRKPRFVEELMAMFALPHPSVVFAGLVMFGLFIGMQAGDGGSMAQQEWSSFLEINEGDWL